MAISSCMHLQALIISIGLLLGLASMLVAGEAPSSGYRVELIHVDANANFTREELISRAVDRTRLREAMLSPAATDGDGTTTTTKVVEAAHFRHYEYLVELKVGADKFLVVADTGSDFVWVKQQISPVFGSVPCDCVKDVSKMSECCSSTVNTFNREYGTRKQAAKGFICRDKVTLSGLMPDKAITLGFAIHYDDHLLPASAHGILGLNRGKMSLLHQLRETKFSYCLSDPIREPKRKSLFWFGEDVDNTWQSTPLVEMPAPSDMYHIALLGISIVDGSSRYKDLRYLTKDYFEHKSKQGDGVMFVDSGCSRTLLETRVFSELVNLLQGELKEEPKFITKEDKFIPDKYTVFTCFSDTSGKKPTLALHLKEGTKGAVMRILWNNYMLWDEAESKFCLTINQIKGKSVMGNILQHDIHMHFDLEQKKLSFKPVTDCTMEL